MFITVAPNHLACWLQFYQHACLLELHLTSRYVWISCNSLARTSVDGGGGWTSRDICYICLNQQVYLLPLPQARSYVPMLVPNQRAGKHNCTRPSGMYVTVAPGKQPCLYNLLTISMQCCMSVTVSFYQHPCILHLHPTISHSCNNCIRPFAKYFTVAPYQQSCMLNLHLQACMSNSLALDQHSYFL